MISESSSASRRPQEIQVLQPLVQSDPIEGFWVLVDTNLGLKADMTFFTIKDKCTALVSASGVTCKLIPGPTPHTILLADGFLRLLSDRVMRLSSNSGLVALFKRQNSACFETIAALQGCWKHRGKTRFHRKTMSIQGLVYKLSTQDFQRRHTSKGLLQCQEGAATMTDFKIKIMAHNAIRLQSPSGVAWRFARQG